MKIGPITQAGHMLKIPLEGQDSNVTLFMMDYEAGHLVGAILLALATADPVKWKDAQETVREVLR